MEKDNGIVKREGAAALENFDVDDETSNVSEQENVAIDPTDDIVGEGIMPVITPSPSQPASPDITAMLQIMMIQFNEFKVQLNEQRSEIKSDFKAELNDKLNEQKSEIKAELNSKFNEHKSEIKAELNSKFNEHKTEINALKEGLKNDFQERLDDRFSRWENELCQKLSELDIKFTNDKFEIETKIERNNKLLNDKLEHHEQKLDRIVGTELEIQSQVNDCKSDIDSINHKIENVESKMEKANVKMTGEIINLRKEVDDIHVNGNQSEAVVKSLIGQTVDNMKDQLKKEMEDLHSKIDSMPQNGATQTFPVVFPPDLHFSGKRGENPCLFLKRIDTHFELARPVSEAMKPKYIQQLLRGSAAEWMLTLSEFPRCLADFRDKFLERYWNQTHRYKFEREQLDDKWNERGNLSMTEYAIKKIASFRMCDTQIPTQQLLWVISTHFPERIQNLLNSVEINGVDRFLELLTRYDRIREFNSNNPTQKSKMDNNGRPIPEGNNAQRWEGNDRRYDRPYQNGRDRRENGNYSNTNNFDGQRYAPYRRGNGGSDYRGYNRPQNNASPPRVNGNENAPPPLNPSERNEGNNVNHQSVN